MTKQTITLAHGNGGQLMQELLRTTVIPGVSGDASLSDGAVLPVGNQEIVFSTDSFTVQPLFFPGGDIGTLAVSGTVNDVAAMGAKPLYLSCGAIIEEGFPLADLQRILASMQRVATEQGVRIVTGDTKVVEHGSGDGIFINTAGIGIRQHALSKRFGQIKVGDVVVVSGTVGDHGSAIALARNPLGLETQVQSDSAALGLLVDQVLSAGLEVVFMRDPTRGGLATVLNELVISQQFGIEISETTVPVSRDVQSVCEILGYDPLYLANEGKMIFVVSAGDADALVSLLRADALGRGAAIIGQVTSAPEGKVVLQTKIGGKRVLDMLVYDQLPRIC